MRINSLGWKNFTVINSPITTKKLFVPQRFDFHQKSSSGEGKQSFLLSVLGIISKSCAKKAVVRMAELVAAMNREEGSYQLSHTYDRFLRQDLLTVSKTERRNDCFPSPDEDFWWKSKRWGTNNFLVVTDEFITVNIINHLPMTVKTPSRSTRPTGW